MRLVTLILFAIGIAMAQQRPTVRTLLIPYSGGNTWYALGYPSVHSVVMPGSVASGTLLRSDDAGRTWTTLQLAPVGEYQFVDFAAVHPDRPQIVYAVRTRARGGISRSEDGGRTWRQVNEGLPAIGELRDVAILTGTGEAGRVRIANALYGFDAVALRWSKLADLPATTSVMTFDVARAQRGALIATPGIFYVTSNGGASWTARGRLADGAGDRTGLQIVFDPRDEGLAFVRSHSTAAGDGRCPSPGGGTYRTADGGQSFTYVNETGYCDASREAYIDPVRENVYLGTANLSQPYCISTNRGLTFNCISTPGSVASMAAIHPRTGQIWLTNLVETSTNGAASFSPFVSSMVPALYVPQTITASTTEGAQSTASLPVTYADTTASTPFARYRASLVEPAPWLTLGTATGDVGFTTSITLRLSAAALEPGAHTARVRVEVDGTRNLSFVATVVFQVTPKAVTGVRYRFERLMGSAPSTTAVQENVLASLQSAQNSRAVARDTQGNVYVMIDRRLRKIDTNGRITTVAGTGTDGVTADGTPAMQAQFRFIENVVVGRDGTIFLRESIGVRLYGIKDGVVRVVLTESSPVVSRAAALRSMCQSPSGSVYVNDGSRIIRVDAGREPEVVSGYSNFTTSLGAALFDCAAESDSSWLLSDPLSHRIFRWNQTGLNVVAGTRTESYSGDGGQAREADLDSPRKMAVDSEGNIVFNDSGNTRMRLIRPDGRIFTISGSSFVGSELQGGNVATANFSPTDISAEPNGNLLVSTFAGVFRFVRQPFGTPVLQSNSVVNGASQLAPVSPGALITIYGAELSLETRAASFAPLVTALAGAEILVNGQPIPIVFASPGQVNAQLPPTIAAGPAKLRSRVDGKQSAEIDIQIRAASPGIFIYGNNRAVAQNQDGVINGVDNGEAPGRFAVLYVTGIGATDNPVAAGVLSPANPLARAVGAVELRVGDRVANVLFTGLTPGFVGLGQVNFEVPDLDAGDYPIVLQIAGQASNAPLFRVAARP